VPFNTSVPDVPKVVEGNVTITASLTVDSESGVAVRESQESQEKVFSTILVLSPYTQVCVSVHVGLDIVV